MKKSLFAITLFLLAASLSSAQTNPGVERGKSLFTSDCASCHTIGGGVLVGPDLKGVTESRSPGWLERFIREPGLMVQEKDPIAVRLVATFGGLVMPSLGLARQDVSDIMSYLASAGGPPTGGTASAGQPSPNAVTPASPGRAKGDSASGRAFFTGERRFGMGGTQCMACHAVSGLGILGGGTVGPDLSQAFTKYGGQAGLTGVLSSVPFPTMAPLYRDRPLTPQELADLAAFLQGSGGGAAASGILPLILIVTMGLTGLFVLLYALWSKRLKDIRDSLAAR